MVTFNKTLCVITALYMWCTPAVGATGDAESLMMVSKNCVTYSNEVSSTKTTECLVAKKKTRHAYRRHRRHSPQIARVKPVKSYGAGSSFREDVFELVRRQAVPEDTWRQFQEWLHRQPPSYGN